MAENPLLPHPNGNRNGNRQDDFGIECKIPPLWKRLLAEFLDFLILFVFKLAVTWIAIEFFDLINLARFRLDSRQVDISRMDYLVALLMIDNINTLELFHGVIVSTFEASWLVGGVEEGRTGQSPGKSMMGLRVVRCENVTFLSENDETVVVYPGTDLGYGRALARSFIKNLALALFTPFVAFYYAGFPFNRTGYDMICHTIVIEEPIVQRQA